MQTVQKPSANPNPALDLFRTVSLAAVAGVGTAVAAGLIVLLLSGAGA
jgi:hypothetical protein